MSNQNKAIEVGKLNLNELSAQIHEHNKAKGFYNSYEKITDALRGDPGLQEEFSKIFGGQRIALMHSELSESLEGTRKDLQDDHLPDLKMEEVEYADAIIRILDVCGFKNIDIVTAIERKLAYNMGRPYMHGKKF
jgi:hypothetical protein